MPDWKDELKAEIGDLMRSLDFDTMIINNLNVHKKPATDLKQLCALILELIDHIPEEKRIGEFCLKCGHQLTWEGQRQLRCLNPDCVDFRKPLLGWEPPKGEK